MTSSTIVAPPPATRPSRAEPKTRTLSPVSPVIAPMPTPDRVVEPKLAPFFVPLPGAVIVAPIGVNSPCPGPTHDEISAEANRIWLATGGNEVVNWLEAEARLQRRLQVG